MKFENIKIKNFRNFEDVNIDLSNKNIFFGLNDVGKTNFLYALRYIFDKDVRKLNLIDSDFHNKQLYNSFLQELKARMKTEMWNKEDATLSLALQSIQRWNSCSYRLIILTGKVRLFSQENAMSLFSCFAGFSGI